jgi:hypothetical protein
MLIRGSHVMVVLSIGPGDSQWFTFQSRVPHANAFFPALSIFLFIGVEVFLSMRSGYEVHHIIILLISAQYGDVSLDLTLLANHTTSLRAALRCIRRPMRVSFLAIDCEPCVFVDLFYSEGLSLLMGCMRSHINGLLRQACAYFGCA